MILFHIAGGACRVLYVRWGLLYELEGFHVAVGGLEVGDVCFWGVGDEVAELSDGFFGDDEFGAFFHVVIDEGDGFAQAVDLCDVGGVDGMASPDAFEVDVGDCFRELHEVLQAGKEGDGSAAFEFEGDVVAVVGYVHDIGEFHFGEFVTGAEINGAVWFVHACRFGI